jgi:Zn-dependent protease with chaperone function
MILLRLLICLILFYLPFVLFVAANRRQPENALWLIFPMFGTIPAIVGALLIFVPIENYLSARALGHLNDVAIPIAGALLIAVFMIVTSILSGNLPRYFSRILKEGKHVLGPILFWSVLGLAWGALWRLSNWLMVEVGLTSKAGCVE